jgi:RNA polymerase sigma factor (sigma-70 family)
MRVDISQGLLTGGPRRPALRGADSPGLMADTTDQLERLVRQYARLIRAAVRRVAGSRADLLADDVQQSVALALWQQISHERTIRHPVSYVYRAAVRETVRAIKRDERQRGGDVALEQAAAAAAPGDLHQTMALEQQLAAALATLSPERERAVRAHLAGFDVAAIMPMYGWSYQKARNLIARGMSDLRSELRRRGVDG